MKNKCKKINFLLLLAFLFSLSTYAQCDTCTTPWGSSETKIYYNQQIQGLMSGCLVNLHLIVQSRVCNGKLQIRLEDCYVERLNLDPNCNMACFHVGPLIDRAMYALLVEYGGNVVVYKPSACYYLLEFTLTPALRACFGKEAGSSRQWYAALPCGTNGCCLSEYILQPGGYVQVVTSVSTPCSGMPPNPIPAFITVRCGSNGIYKSYPVPVVPPTQPLTCETTCYNDGDIFTPRTAPLLPAATETATSDKAAGLRIFPQPARGQVTAVLPEGVLHKTCAVRIVTAQGQTLLQQKLAVNHNRVQVSVHTIPAGVYYLEIVAGQQRYFQQLQIE